MEGNPQTARAAAANNNNERPIYSVQYKCSTTTIMATPSVWVQLHIKGEDEPSGDPIKIKPAPDDVADLKELLKTEKAKKTLEHCDALKLKVFPPGTKSFSEDKAIDPGDAVPGGTTSKNPLIVVAPDPTSKRQAEDALVGDPTFKKPRELVREFDFQSMAVSLEEVSLPDYNDENMPDFIAPDGWLDQILESTIENADRKDAHHPKVVPTALTRISRGGKSRSLQELAVAITSSTEDATSAYRIVKISFNTDTPIEEWEQKNPLQALCVRIAFAARKDTSVIFEIFKLSVNVARESVVGWLGVGTKCILMIDELNRLHLNTSVAEFLKSNFLIPAGRGLVFTSHVVSLNSTLSDYMDSASNREIISVKLPDVVSLTDTRTKLGANSSGEGASSSTLSPQHIVYLGKIPALIHTYLSPKGKLPQMRRAKVVGAWLKSSAFNLHAVEQLLSSMISGRISEVPIDLLEFMDIDKDVNGNQNIVRWVPYHMQFITEEMADSNILSHDMRGCLRAIAELFEDFKDSKVQSGDSWEALFLIALLVRCLSRKFDDMILPLVDIPDEAQIRYNKPYSGNHFYSENPSEFISGVPVAGRSSVSLYWPGHAKFENYDIVVAVWDDEGQRSLYGYQCKEGSSLPRAFANEDLFVHSCVIRGAAVAKGQSVRMWHVPNDAKLQELFGVSSTHWSPQAWKALKG